MSTKKYTKRQSYDYHEDTVAASTHAIERHVQRLTSLTQTERALVTERAIAAAAHKANREHTGVRILTTSTQHVWAVVAGRTVKTIMVTAKGQHLDSTSPCNRYAIVA